MVTQTRITGYTRPELDKDRLLREGQTLQGVGGWGELGVEKGAQGGSSCFRVRECGTAVPVGRWKAWAPVCHPGPGSVAELGCRVVNVNSGSWGKLEVQKTKKPFPDRALCSEAASEPTGALD